MTRTLTALISALESIGLPFTQVEWMNGTAPELPYIILMPSDTNNWFADGKVNETPVMYLVELYTRVRDVALEVEVQTALNDAGIGWERATVPISDGRGIMTRWYTQVFER